MLPNPSLPWQIRGRTLDLSNRVLVMGILNVTPDSFSDGGRYFSVEQAVAQALRLVAEGADILDIGGESTRPGAETVPVEEETRRVVPVVRALVESGQLGECVLSIDTSKGKVAGQCLEAGAHIINDVTALQGDAEMPAIVKQFEAGVVLMHMQGTPATMQIAPTYGDVVVEVCAFLEARLQALADVGIGGNAAAVDPGIGFGKTTEHNWTLLAHLDAFSRLGRPVCLGVSRKGFVKRLLGRETPDRLAGSLAVACHAMARRSVQILRVHDVAATRDAVRVFMKLSEGAEARL